MIASLKRLWRDRRGNALVIAGAALPMLVGAAGLATDTVQWALWKRELQRAADSAAFAGVYAKAMSDSASSAVTTDLATNNQTGITLKSGYPQIAYPTSGTYTNAVQVTLAVQKRLGFSSLFLSTAPTITTSATAAMIDTGEYCVVALENTTATGITIGGNSTVNMGCGAISNSKSQSSAVAANGSSYNFVASPVAAVGGLPSAITGVTTLQPHHIAMPDPFASQYSTDVPAGMNCQTFQQHASNGSTNPKTLTPGCFTSFAPNGSDTYNLQPGVYYLQNTDMALNGNDTLVGTGVTFIFTGTTPGSPKINGTSTTQISAPTASNCATVLEGGVNVNTCNYNNMLFIQSPNAALNNGTTINGTNSSKYDGAMYFPKGQVSFNGTSGSMTKCAMVVANQVVFSGNTALQNDTVGCTAAIKKKGKAIRLIA